MQQPHGFQVGAQIAISGETGAAGMAEGALQIGRFLLAIPADAPQFQIQFRQLIAPVVGIGGQLGRWFGRRFGVGRGVGLGL